MATNGAWTPCCEKCFERTAKICEWAKRFGFLHPYRPALLICLCGCDAVYVSGGLFNLETRFL